MKFLLQFDPASPAIINAKDEEPSLSLPKKLLFAFVEKTAIDDFLTEVPHKILGKFETISFSPNIYQVCINDDIFCLCQVPLGAPAACQLLDFLHAHGVRQVLAVGSCGSLVPMPEGKLLLVDKAWRDEGCSRLYQPDSNYFELYSAWQDQVKTALNLNKVAYQDVTTWTTDGFFRETKSKVTTMMQVGCQVVEMECAGLISVAKFYHFDFAQILFTADSLANLEHDPRNWGKKANQSILSIVSPVLAKL
ncbi:nucleoside phosphorylase [Lactobacillus corticis]|uniref:Pnp/Udp family phosphorylase n=1 Tax=Lactobacillus corticis TaxID=2201249 RepID=A0A916QJG6_9LACO|nr:nucleoside phosphorylase [Lactobacillus corticis]GFZ26226.1 Pnp/Udp family phosphorylase [Lactobacillus corticis]